LSFSFVNLPELQFDLDSETTDNGRFYTTPSGIKYPSVTTVLSASGDKEALKKWIKRVGEEEAEKIKRKAGNRGTRMHSLCEDYLKGKLTKMKMQSLMPFDKMLFNMIRPLLDNHVNDVYCMEQALYSDKLKIAGRVDLIASWRNKIAVIDFKTSLKEKKEEWIQNYFIQCTAYALMFEDLTGQCIDDIVVLIATEEQTAQVFERKKEVYIPILHKYINEYCCMK